MVDTGNSWNEILKDEFKKDYYLKLRDFLKYEYSHYRIYPKMENIFNFLRYTAYENVKVVIIGQDPYHGAGQAHGLCFSVQKGTKAPPSLCNIFKELSDDLGCKVPTHGQLTGWAMQGVLLMNTVLTVREGQANSHKSQGWEIFTDKVIEILNQRETPIVFLLWGANAGAKSNLITKSRHLVLRAAHPSPLSAYNGFFGCGHFSKANAFLESTNQAPIDWQITDNNA